MRALLDEVAARVGTRPVDNVYVTPGTNLAVMERGGVLRQLGSSRERCLILGAGVLDGMRIGWLKAILAHEHGHFSNRDTAGGGFALAVRRSLVTFGQNLARHSAAAWYNPAWLFVNAFYRIFLRVSQGASRLQEVLADRWAAFSYGSPAFEDGLRHVIASSVRFNAHVGATLEDVVENKHQLENLYTYRPGRPASPEEIEQAIEQRLHAKASPYDSHPAPADRLAWVRAVATPGTTGDVSDQNEAWSLFAGGAAIQRQMTARIRDNVRRVHGIEIPDGSRGDDDKPDDRGS